MISNLAHVDPSAKIGNNVTIMPFAFVDKNVEIGDDSVIMPYAGLFNGTIIGKRNTIYCNAMIGVEPQDFHYKGDDSKVIIGDDNKIRENVVIARGTYTDGATRIGDGSSRVPAERLRPAWRCASCRPTRRMCRAKSSAGA